MFRIPLKSCVVYSILAEVYTNFLFPFVNLWSFILKLILSNFFFLTFVFFIWLCYFNILCQKNRTIRNATTKGKLFMGGQWIILLWYCRAAYDTQKPVSDIMVKLVLYWPWTHLCQSLVMGISLIWRYWCRAWCLCSLCLGVIFPWLE